MQFGLSEKYADELAFIREIMFDLADDTPRMIYADWLDERNDLRGEFLRLDLRLTRLTSQRAASSDARLDTLAEHRARLIKELDPQWVSLLAKSPIELCPQKLKFKFMCPKRWENLRPFGDDQSVRYCDQCGKSVTYCFTIADARARAMRGQCVAIDASVERASNDLTSIEQEFYETIGLIYE